MVQSCRFQEAEDSCWLEPDASSEWLFGFLCFIEEITSFVFVCYADSNAGQFLSMGRLYSSMTNHEKREVLLEAPTCVADGYSVAGGSSYLCLEISCWQENLRWFLVPQIVSF